MALARFMRYKPCKVQESGEKKHDETALDLRPQGRVAGALMRLAWLLRAARWAHRPPSWGRVVLVICVIALCAGIWGAEQIFGFPQWLVPNKIAPPR